MNPVTSAGCTGCVDSVASEKPIGRIGVIVMPPKKANIQPPQIVPFKKYAPNTMDTVLPMHEYFKANVYLFVLSKKMPVDIAAIVPKRTNIIAINADYPEL